MKILLKYLLLNLYSELFFINIYYSFPVLKAKIKIKNIFYIIYTIFLNCSFRKLFSCSSV